MIWEFLSNIYIVEYYYFMLDSQDDFEKLATSIGCKLVYNLQVRKYDSATFLRCSEPQKIRLLEEIVKRNWCPNTYSKVENDLYRFWWD